MAMATRHQTENAANAALAGLLAGMLPDCAAHRVPPPAAADQPEPHPDVLITAAGRAPVAIAAGYEPNPDLEADARSLLGVLIAGETRPAAAVALRYPESIAMAIAEDGNLSDALSNARLSYCVLYASGARFPESGWLTGNLAGLADLILQVARPPRAVDAAVAALERGIGRVANVLDEMAAQLPGIGPAIALRLGRSDVPQTRWVVGATIADALIFQERLAATDDAVPPVHLVCGRYVRNPERETLAAWDEILRVKHWDIFAIGRDILNRIPTFYANRILRHLAFTIGEVNNTGVSHRHNLTHRIFQRLTVDRKYLATSYTLPPSAALLSLLAVSKMGGIDWGDGAAIGRLRVGDFACGTGEMLAAAYERIVDRHAHAAGPREKLHPAMMQEVLYGCDVMPSAIHTAAATLAAITPTVRFDHARLYTLAYGRQEDGSVRIGSLELLQTSAVTTLCSTGDPAQRASGAGAATAAQIVADIPDAGFDLVIMNPPSIKSARQRDADGNVRNAAFAAFGAQIGDEGDMAARLAELAQDSCYVGQCGLGVAFAAIADRKVRPGGVIALMILTNSLSVKTWAEFRRMIAERYTDITIVSIAAHGADTSFSPDSGVSECLVIGRRLAADEAPTGRAQFISLRRLPRNFAEAQEMVNVLMGSAEVRNLEDDPVGGMPIYLDGILVGEILNAPLVNHKSGWRAECLADAHLAQVAHALAGGKLRLPATAAAYDLPIARLGEVGQLGVYDADLTRTSHGHDGPFVKAPPAPAAQYPALYHHSARRETRLIREPDSQLRVRPGRESRALELWARAGRSHLSRDFAFGSQTLAVAFTDLASLGGISWPNIGFADNRFDYAFAIWGNSTLGMLCYWWHSNRQLSSRSNMDRSLIPTLPILDLRALSDGQLATAQAIFDEFRDQDLQLAYLADADPNRALLDRRVVCDLLGLDDGVYQGVRRLAARWCAEPSVNAGKNRPASARFAA